MMFRGGSMINKKTLETINNSIGIISGIWTIYTTLISIDTVAGGTLGAGNVNSHLLLN